MSVAFLMLFAGFILVIAGWDNLSVFDALRGNFDKPKPAAGTFVTPQKGARG